MEKQKNKTIVAIALALILTISALMAIAPNNTADAHDPAWTVPSWTFLTISPDPVGVNQVLWVVFWVEPNIPTASGATGDRYTFMVDATKPDGGTETLGPIKSDPGGMAYILYTPTQVGRYTFVAKFQGITLTGIPGNEDHPAVGDTILASSSNPVQVTVQEDPIEMWQETSLPTEYWTRPINQLNRNWDVLAANWLGKLSAAHTIGYAMQVGQINYPRLYSSGPGPESSHIVWSRQFWDGGIMDERFGNSAYQSVHYEGLRMFPPIILNGRLIYANYDTAGSMAGWWVVDLYTGETISFYDSERHVRLFGGSVKTGPPTFASIYNYGSPNQHGGFPFIWMTTGVSLPEGYTSRSGTQTWEMLDGYTFETVAKIANVSSGGFPVYGKDGSILRYSLATNGGKQYLRCWNVSHIETMGRVPEGELGTFQPEATSVHNGDTAWSLNVSISPPVSGPILAVREDEYVIGGTEGKHNATDLIEGNLWALNLENGHEGEMLWNITFTPPETVVPDTVPKIAATGHIVSAIKHRKEAGLHMISPENGVFTFFEGVTLQRWGYSLETGNLLWGPTEPEPPLNFWDSMPAVIYEGKLISWGYSGVVTAYDIMTGEVLWKYTAESVGYEVPYGNTPLNLHIIADGKLYFAPSEHSPDSPLTRSYYLRCVNASNGVELWKSSLFGTATEGAGQGSMETAFIADGYLVAFNAYDAKIYAFAKGPSETTVSIEDDVIRTGESVLITGTVTDIAAGTTDHVIAARFPNGVPAVSDESMNEWMEYIYKQQQQPTDVIGVTVKLKAVRSDGRTVNIGTAVSDSDGFFKMLWAPAYTGEYSIIAEFEGTKSYYGSRAITGLGVLNPYGSTGGVVAEPLIGEARVAQTTIDLTIISAALIAAVALIVTGIILRKKK